MKWQVIMAALVFCALSFAPAALAGNPPGAAGGIGHGRYWHHNPKGPCGGPGSSWVYNPPGPGKVVLGGRANPPGPLGGPGRGRYWR